jgi:hypothetical protein
MMKVRELLVGFGIVAMLFVLLLGGCSEETTKPADNPQNNNAQFELSDFSSALACKGCHPNHYNEWEGSMHAYAFIDPINTAWMNGLRNEVGAEKLGQFCVQCHSPIGFLTGETPIGFDKENVDPLVKEGINCDVCHLMEKASVTALGDAVYHYDVKSGKQYGSIMDPVPNEFHSSEGKSFFKQSNACLPCHDLINHNGLPAEITFTEWAQSLYAMSSVECQDCHMESYSGKAAVNGPHRNDLHRHDFIGVDIALLDDFPNKNAQRLKIEQLLQNSVTLSAEVPDSVKANSTLPIKVIVFNDKTGHDIPSSVTFVRQMWLEVTVTNGLDTLYKSGYFDANGDLMDEHSVLNPNGDPDLVLFQSALYKGSAPANVFTADSIRIGSIRAFESKSNQYLIPLSTISGNSVKVRIRLRFRTFPPYAIRDGAAEFIDKIPVFEMEEFENSIIVYQ